LGFQLGTAVSRLVQKWERNSYKQMEKQYTNNIKHRIHQIEKEHKCKNNIKKSKSSGYKIRKRSKQL
jgi:hypothetical protein